MDKLAMFAFGFMTACTAISLTTPTLAEQSAIIEQQKQCIEHIKQSNDVYAGILLGLKPTESDPIYKLVWRMKSVDEQKIKEAKEATEK
jgi:hypothetical protein